MDAKLGSRWRSPKIGKKHPGVLRAIVVELKRLVGIEAHAGAIRNSLRESGIGRVHGGRPTRRVEHPARAGCGYTEAHRRFALDRLYPSSPTYTDWVLSENLFESEGGRGRPAQASTVFSSLARTFRNFRLHEMPAKAVKQVEEAPIKRMRILDQDGSVFGAPNKHDHLRLSVV
jgi:hypothetical protein